MSEGEGRRPGRPAVIDRDRIVATACELGFDELSMVAVARRLGVSGRALYRYFESVDDLRAACVDVFCSRIEVPSVDSEWRAFMHGLGWAFVAACRSMPGAASTAFRLGPASPAALAIIETSLSVLVDAGFAPRLAWRSYAGVVDLALVSALKEEAVARQEPLGDAFASLSAEEVPTTMVVMAELASPPDFDAAFGEQLTIVLDGIELQLQRQ